MKTPQRAPDWRTVGSWKLGALMVFLLGVPFADYVIRFAIGRFLF